MSRTSRSVPALALLAVLSSVALTGCSDSKSGAAAVVGGDRIEISSLNQRVKQAADVRASVGEKPVPGVEASQQELSLMIDERVTAEAARRAGISATQTEVTNAEHAYEAANQVPVKLVAAHNGIPDDRIDAVFRMIVLKQKLEKANPGKSLNKLLADTADSLKVTVNPRYGKDWVPNDVGGQISPTDYAWLTPNQIVTA
ncbi:SurA N-terminal domain-containing protein [Yinghuangia seranimata]|uniref:SurA N-terminal domain-containing protein n=1 Tax=Yinghuangia seranimata TaxID=408067 RepID=UPI00248BE9E4|nr:SurA N-terminal domain-containing protein [Yinghuangia seranimata]MDI2126733.1 SurA N-terminal domain-containing protein [Yinghuangia seranimata]